MAYIEDLMSQSSQLFEKRGNLLSLWQTIADNFYPERADFTTVRNVGSEFLTNATTSYPYLARRDLGNSIGSMLRPTSKAWFHARTNNYDKISDAGKEWLQRATDKMRQVMNNDKSQFARATKEGDHDFAAFGQTVIQVSLNSQANNMLYRCWHLRDVAWTENADGAVSTVFRKWQPTARELHALFKAKVHGNVSKCVAEEPYKEFNVVHCIIPIEDYRGDEKFRTPYVSIYFDTDNKHIMEEVGIWTQQYIVPRWSTVSGSQYAYSPATITALPDARLIQAMTRVLLESGEKATNPPMIAVQEAIRSDISIYAGGITWVDAAYDERLGEVLRPLTQEKGGLNFGMEMVDRVRMVITECFFINKINLPPPGADMTAYEVGQRVQEYIRQAMPLFEPMESQYNSPLCSNTFEVMMRAGAFGSMFDMPEELLDNEVEFVFESPLHDAIEREKGQRFLEAKSMLAQAIELDSNAADMIDASKALRDVLEGIGVPASWTRSEDEITALAAQREQQQQTAELLAQMQAGANVAKTLGEAGQVAPQPQPAGVGAGV